MVERSRWRFTRAPEPRPVQLTPPGAGIKDSCGCSSCRGGRPRPLPQFRGKEEVLRPALVPENPDRLIPGRTRSVAGSRRSSRHRDRGNHKDTKGNQKNRSQRNDCGSRRSDFGRKRERAGGDRRTGDARRTLRASQRPVCRLKIRGRHAYRSPSFRARVLLSVTQHTPAQIRPPSSLSEALPPPLDEYSHHF